jgi:hypothetical protein
MSELDKSSLWRQVEKTDLSFTKTVNQRGGYTAISPQYQLKQATKVFGPYGSGFGLKSSDMDYRLYEIDGIVVHKAVFFYVFNGEEKSFPITNAIEAVRNTAKGRWFDVDFAKKVETNTVSKALSKLGFNADVFMGMFEDNAYMQELSNELQIKKADDKDAEKVRQRQEYEEWKQSELTVYAQLKTLNSLKTAYTGHVRKCERRGDESGMKLFKTAYENRLAELGGDLQ